MLKFVETEKEHDLAKETALEIMSLVSDKHMGNYKIAIQAIEMAFDSLLQEEHDPKSIMTAYVLNENLEELQRVVKPDFAYPKLQDYENILGHKANEAVQIGWTMARTTNEFIKKLGETANE